MKYPCRRKRCRNKQGNGRCQFEQWTPKSESKCEKFLKKAEWPHIEWLEFNTSDGRDNRNRRSYHHRQTGRHL